jgi:hypothetical protein
MTIVRAAMHLATGYHIDIGKLLFEDGGFGATVLRVGQSGHGELSDR